MKIIKLLGVLCVLNVLTNPLVYLPWIFGTEYRIWVSILGGLFVAGCILATLTAKKGNKIIDILCYLYAILSMAILIVSGVRWTNVAGYVMPLFGIVALYRICVTKGGTSMAVKMIMIAMVGHMIISILPLRMPSQYEVISYGASGIGMEGQTPFVDRARGLLISPGYLTVYAAMGVGVGLCGLVVFGIKREYVIIGLSSIVCGAASLNRTFPVLLGIAWIGAIIQGARNGRRIARVFIVVPVLLIIVTAVILESSNYLPTISERYDPRKLEEAKERRWSGVSGVLQPLELLMESPITGIAKGDKYGSLGIWNGRTTLQPHNGFIWLLSMKGVLLGGIGVIVVISSLVRMFRGEDKIVPFGVGMACSVAACMTEPLLECGAITTLLGMSFAATEEIKIRKESGAIAKSVKT